MLVADVIWGARAIQNDGLSQGMQVTDKVKVIAILGDLLYLDTLHMCISIIRGCSFVACGCLHLKEALLCWGGMGLAQKLVREYLIVKF